MTIGPEEIDDLIRSIETIIRRLKRDKAEMTSVYSVANPRTEIRIRMFTNMINVMNSVLLSQVFVSDRNRRFKADVSAGIFGRGSCVV